MVVRRVVSRAQMAQVVPPKLSFTPDALADRARKTKKSATVSVAGQHGQSGWNGSDGWSGHTGSAGHAGGEGQRGGNGGRGGNGDHGMSLCSMSYLCLSCPSRLYRKPVTWG